MLCCGSFSNSFSISITYQVFTPNSEIFSLCFLFKSSMFNFSYSFKFCLSYLFSLVVLIYCTFSLLALKIYNLKYNFKVQNLQFKILSETYYMVNDLLLTHNNTTQKVKQIIPIKILLNSLLYTSQLT